MRQLLLTAILVANTSANSENFCEIAIDSDYYYDGYYMNYEKPNEQEEVCRGKKDYMFHRWVVIVHHQPNSQIIFFPSGWEQLSSDQWSVLGKTHINSI